MSYKLLGIDSVGGLTELLLAELESLQVVPGERPVKKPRLAFIERLIVEGRFNRCEWARCHCKEDGKDYRVNGQHTSTKLRAVISNEVEGGTFPEGIPVLMSRYECDTIEELGDVFDCLDHHSSTRSPDDRLGVFMAHHRDLIGIDKQICSRVLAGIAWGVSRVPTIQEALGESSLPSEAYDRGILLESQVVRDFIDLMHQHAGSPFKEWQQKSGIIARLFDLFITDRETAELAIEQTMCEAGDKAEEFTKKVRQSCSKTGKDQGFYYRSTDKYVKSQLKEIASVGRDAIKEMIREVMDEEEVETEAAA